MKKIFILAGITFCFGIFCYVTSDTKEFSGKVFNVHDYPNYQIVSVVTKEKGVIMEHYSYKFWNLKKLSPEDSVIVIERKGLFINEAKIRKK
jgi:hypothetical protein